MPLRPDQLKTERLKNIRLPNSPQSQSAHAISVGYQHEHSSMSRAFLDVIRKRGFFALWTGVTAAIPRVMVGSSVQLTTFAYSKQLIDRGLIREHGKDIDDYRSLKKTRLFTRL